MNHILCGIIRSIAGRLRVTAVLLYLALTGLHLGCCVKFWAPQYETCWQSVVSAAEGHRDHLGWKTDVQEDGTRLSSKMHKSNGHEVQQGKSQSETRRGLFTLCAVKQWPSAYPERFRNRHPWRYSGLDRTRQPDLIGSWPSFEQEVGSVCLQRSLPT